MKPNPNLQRPPAPAGVLTASAPADVLSVIPYLLGFHPEQSLVLVVCRDREVVVAARVDLDPTVAVGHYTAEFDRIALRNDADSLILVCYSDDHTLAAAYLDGLLGELDRFTIVDALISTEAVGSGKDPEHRWFSRLCADPACCPAEGTVYRPESSAIAAQAVVQGITALPRRADLERMVAGPAAGDARALEAAFQEVTAELMRTDGADRVLRMRDFLDGFLTEPRPLEPAECAHLAALVADITVRDEAWCAMSRASAARHVDLWTQVVRHTVSPFEMAPLCLLGAAGWLSGNGALQVVCIQRAERIDPSYSMLGLLSRINEAGTPPKLWDEMALSGVGGARPGVDGTEPGVGGAQTGVDGTQPGAAGPAPGEPLDAAEAG